MRSYSRSLGYADGRDGLRGGTGLGGSRRRSRGAATGTPRATGQRTDAAVIAVACTEGPAQETVGNVRDVAVRSDALTQVPRGSDRARVVAAGSLVVGRDAAAALLSETLLQTIASSGTLGAVLDHLQDLALRAWALHIGTVVAGAGAVVALHETRVVDAVVGCRDTDTAVAFLHDDGQDEARVDAAGLGDRVDAVLDVVDFLVGVVGDIPLSTARPHDLAVVLEPETKKCISF